MGRKRHFRQKRRPKKRRKIDLQNLGKQKKKGQFQQSEQPQKKESKSIQDQENTRVVEESESEEESVSSYQQLLSTLSKVSHKSYKYSDEEDESEEEEEEEDNYEESHVNQLEGGDSRAKSDEEVSDEDDDGSDGDDIRHEEPSEDEEKSDNEDVSEEGENEDQNGDEDDEIDEEEEEEEGENEDDKNDKSNIHDVFFRRMDHDIGEKLAAKLAERKVGHRREAKWPCLGRMLFSSLTDQPTDINIDKGKSFQELHVRKRIAEQWRRVNEDILSDDDQIFSPYQEELFSVMNSYQDLLYTERNYKNAEELRNVYCLHVLNHIVKSRTTVLKHNSMLSADPNLDSETMRDQGLTRPRVLIVVPFRDAALRIVKTFIKLLETEGATQHVSHRKRFQEEYSEVEEYQAKIARPEDWLATFSGNTDDHFRIGLAVSRKHLRLYTKFYLSDIIIASPLGLRTVIGAKGDKHQDYDFLSSIEILVMDQADVFLMQNWEHITHLIEHMHLQPRESHDVDFSRVRMWNLNEWSKFYRQTLIFSSISAPELNSLYSRNCYNFAGRVLVQNTPTNGSICQVVTQLPQVFHKVDCSSFSDAAQKRFDFFVAKILPQFRESIMAGTMIFVPSYFDFVRLRNYFRKQEIEFAQICEYTSQSNISRARQYMFKGHRHFILYTERFHFYRSTYRKPMGICY